MHRTDPLVRPFRGFPGSQVLPQDGAQRDLLARTATICRVLVNKESAVSDLERMALASVFDWGLITAHGQGERLRGSTGCLAVLVQEIPKSSGLSARCVSVSSAITLRHRVRIGATSLDDCEDIAMARLCRSVPFFETGDVARRSPPHLRYKIFTDSGAKLELLIRSDGEIVAGELCWSPAADVAMRLAKCRAGPVGRARVTWVPNESCHFECDTARITLQESLNRHHEIVLCGDDSGDWVVSPSQASLKLPRSVLPDHWRGAMPPAEIVVPPVVYSATAIATGDAELREWLEQGMRKLQRAFQEMADATEWVIAPPATGGGQPSLSLTDLSSSHVSLKKRKNNALA
ncbi:hypothetical protein QKT49_gp007 [Acanthamoeba castellanii medusavirus]|uniref:Uncharacterized protein n=1 Tax=Acanthamoeba castellanii medusavirus J1 TaxID=3114988 RepID=A0A3T1CWD4_9VIRU|nr:hypothetical protein QKT49_gp007 [Acanthamoeba castellanii medusavirus]BBI30147.1 hypothetical protein [Acanthamoeba castellanii medusavirus J1]